MAALRHAEKKTIGCLSIQSAPARRASAFFCLARAVRLRLSATFGETAGVDALFPELPALRDLTLGDTEAHCGGHSSWCTFRQRNRRTKRRAHSCNGGQEQRRLGLYAPQKGHRETRRSDNVLDSAGQRVCVLRQPGKLGQGCAERVPAVGTTPQQKGVIHKTLERKHSDQSGLQIRIRSVCQSE